jgi:hypothetical protein
MTQQGRLGAKPPRGAGASDEPVCKLHINKGLSRRCLRDACTRLSSPQLAAAVDSRKPSGLHLSFYWGFYMCAGLANPKRDTSNDIGACQGIIVSL